MEAEDDDDDADKAGSKGGDGEVASVASVASEETKDTGHFPEGHSPPLRKPSGTALREPADPAGAGDDPGASAPAVTFEKLNTGASEEGVEMKDF